MSLIFFCFLRDLVVISSLARLDGIVVLAVARDPGPLAGLADALTPVRALALRGTVVATVIVATEAVIVHPDAIVLVAETVVAVAVVGGPTTVAFLRARWVDLSMRLTKKPWSLPKSAREKTGCTLAT